MSPAATPPPEDPEPNDDTVVAARTAALRLGGAPATIAVRGETGHAPSLDYSVTIGTQVFRPAAAGSRMTTR